MDNHDMEGNRETTRLGHIHGDEGFRSYRLLIRCAESRRVGDCIALVRTGLIAAQASPRRKGQR